MQRFHEISLLYDHSQIPIFLARNNSTFEVLALQRIPISLYLPSSMIDYNDEGTPLIKLEDCLKTFPFIRNWSKIPRHPKILTLREVILEEDQLFIVGEKYSETLVRFLRRNGVLNRVQIRNHALNTDSDEKHDRACAALVARWQSEDCLPDEYDADFCGALGITNEYTKYNVSSSASSSRQGRRRSTANESNISGGTNESNNNNNNRRFSNHSASNRTTTHLSIHGGRNSNLKRRTSSLRDMLPRAVMVRRENSSNSGGSASKDVSGTSLPSFTQHQHNNNNNPINANNTISTVPTPTASSPIASVSQQPQGRRRASVVQFMSNITSTTSDLDLPSPHSPNQQQPHHHHSHTTNTNNNTTATAIHSNFSESSFGGMIHQNNVSVFEDDDLLGADGESGQDHHHLLTEEERNRRMLLNSAINEGDHPNYDIVPDHDLNIRYSDIFRVPLVDEVVRVVLFQILSALAAMHEKGYVHGSVCPKHLVLSHRNDLSSLSLSFFRKLTKYRPPAALMMTHQPRHNHHHQNQYPIPPLKMMISEAVQGSITLIAEEEEWRKRRKSLFNSSKSNNDNNSENNNNAANGSGAHQSQRQKHLIPSSPDASVKNGSNSYHQRAPRRVVFGLSTHEQSTLQGNRNNKNENNNIEAAAAAGSTSFAASIMNTSAVNQFFGGPDEAQEWENEEEEIFVNCVKNFTDGANNHNNDNNEDGSGGAFEASSVQIPNSKYYAREDVKAWLTVTHAAPEIILGYSPKLIDRDDDNEDEDDDDDEDEDDANDEQQQNKTDSQDDDDDKDEATNNSDEENKKSQKRRKKKHNKNKKRISPLSAAQQHAQGTSNITPAGDIWSAAMTALELYTARPLIYGETPRDVFFRTASQFCGCPSHSADPSFHRWFLHATDGGSLPTKGIRPVPLSSVVPMASPVAVDLLSKMLVLDPSQRLTAKEALEHPFFFVSSDDDEDENNSDDDQLYYH